MDNVKIATFMLEYHPVVQALIATLFTWALTAAGAGLVFFFKTMNQKLLDGMLGFTGGVMIAASCWSLLIPSIDKAEELGMIKWLPPTIGFMLGAGFLFVIDKIIPHLHLGFKNSEAEGIKTTWHRSVLLILAITLHNIPEGLAVGVAFGAAALTADAGQYNQAIALAIGIGLQNFPEGLAVAMPLRREGFGRMKSFMYGQASAIVEPIAGVLGAVAVIAMQPILPYALSFAAGAMIFVVIEEVIPESHRGGNHDIATMGGMAGFVVMMILDVALS
jgi:ZIP family zinc transporter